MKKPLYWIIILVVVLILAIFFFYFSFTGVKVQGLVIDLVNQKPIENATVRINNKYYYTNNEGHFVAYKPVFKEVSIVIEKNGYKPERRKILSKGFSSVNSVEVLMSPLDYKNILDYTSKDLASYSSYNFRYTWRTSPDEKEGKTSYMLYQLSKDGVLRFKYVEDDAFGNTILEREIIQAKDTVYYRDSLNPKWIKAKQEEISVAKLQEPLDIIQLFRDPQEPASFVASAPISLYASNGNLITEEALLEKNLNKDSEGIKKVEVRPFSAKWNVVGGKKEAVFYLDANTYNLLRADMYEESPGENGFTVKQELIFSITNINEDFKIELPEI
jgi:hypothetical protein